MPTANVEGGGDSGEDPGEGSVALESSTVDIVVVGDDSFDPSVFEESLNVCWWNFRKTCSYSCAGGSVLCEVVVAGWGNCLASSSICDMLADDERGSIGRKENEDTVGEETVSRLLCQNRPSDVCWLVSWV